MAKALVPDVPEVVDGKSSVTFSIRFSEEQRALLQKAADLRGWTPTQLLRTASLERAVHIINTSTPTRVDFRGLAVGVASLVVGRRRAFRLRGDRDGKAEISVVQDVSEYHGEDPEDFPVEVQPALLEPSQLTELATAARTGGTEFLAMLIEACSSVSAPDRHDLPRPLDPGVVIGERGGGQ